MLYSFHMTFRRGFTVLEALIVLAVFGLLATLAVLSLNSARASLRDAQRLSDVSVVRSALSQYWLEKATYPQSAGLELGQPETNSDMLSAAGFVARTDPTQPVYLNRIPTGPKVNEYYRYRAGTNGYSIRFQTETRTDLGEPNVYYAHATGIDKEDTEK